MDLSGWPLPLLLGIFVAAAAAVWIAGIYLSNASDVLADRFGLGEALGGLVLLALVTNLPEIAITVSAAFRGNLGIAIGNILGGIAVQTVVLVVLDIFGLGSTAALTNKAASLSLVLEGSLVIAVLAVTVLGHELPASLIFARMTPAGVGIVVLWLAGLYLIKRARNGLPWQQDGNASADQPSHQQSKKKKSSQHKKQSTAWSALVFGIGAAVTLVAGATLEVSGDAIAGAIGMNGVLFGATVLAASTSLPEVSTGLGSMKLGAYKMAVSDIFGGNSFLPVLFFVAALISGKAVLPQSNHSDIYLTALAILLTCVYIAGLIFRPRRQIARMGIDSFVVLLLYALGMAGLFAISTSG